MPHIHGDEVHGELTSTDAHVGAGVAFYNEGAPNPTTNPIAARVPLATEQVTVTDIIFVSTAGGAYTLVFYPLSTGVVTDTAGLRIAKGNAQALGGLAHHFETPRCGPPGYGVALIASIGQVDLVVTGFISQA